MAIEYGSPVSLVVYGSCKAPHSARKTVSPSIIALKIISLLLV